MKLQGQVGSTIQQFNLAVRFATTNNVGLSGLSAVDGGTPLAGDRILVKNQTTDSQNGIYTAASGAWARSSDANTSAKVLSGQLIFVEEGGQESTLWVLITPNPIVLGTTALTYEEIGSAAEWVGTRYFAVDYDNGDDGHTGYSDVSMADAGTKAIKTLEHLSEILPVNGNGQTAVVAIRARAAGATYRNIANTADDDLSLHSVFGYQQLIVRGTDTIATASATAFANDTADKICCGAQIFSGTNTAGYNPTGTPTTSIIDCQKVGGAAAALSTEPALVGKRIRFDSATATVALRNVCGMIWSNTSTQITMSANLGTAPSTSDIFYIEEPATAVNSVLVHSNNATNIALPPSFAQSGIQIVGFKAVSSAAPTLEIRGPVALVNVCWIDIPNGTSFSAASCVGPADLRFTNTYTDEALAPATITVGAGVRVNGGITVSSCGTCTILHSANITARFQILTLQSFSVGGGCYSALGALVQGCGTSVAVSNLGGIVLGNQGSSTVRRLRTTSTFTESIAFSRSNAVLHGIDITGVGATPCIAVNGINLNLGIHDVVGSTGNTGIGLNLANARDCSILMGTIAANTFTGTAGQDVAGAGPVFYVHADYARCDLKDAGGNHIQGSGLSTIGSVVRAVNDTNADIGQFKVCRATGSGTVRAAQADTAAKCAGIAGVSQSAFTAAGPQGAMLVNGGGTWIQFDSAPTAGDVAYLSTGTIGNAQNTLPTATTTNQRVRLGNVLAVSGSLGYVSWKPEIESTAAVLQSVASAGDLTLAPTGRAFSITGTTTINAITTTGWLAGSVIVLVFTGVLTVKHNTAGGGGTAKIFLSGSADFATANNSVLVLVYDSTQWQEMSRKAP